MSAPALALPAAAVPSTARQERRHAYLLAGFAVLGGTRCNLTVALTLSGAGLPGPRDRAAFLLAVPVAVGVFAASRRRHRRFGWLLIASGLLWSLATLAESRYSLAYSTRRIAGWCVITLLVYLMLAFPDGVPRTALDRRLARATGALFVLLYLPTALLVERYPAQTPWAQCSAHCPPNAFQLSPREPAFVGAVVRPLRGTALVVLLAAVTVVLLRCAIVASPLRRRTLAPVVAGAVPKLLAFIAFTIVRQAAPGWAGVPVLAWIAGLSVCTIPLGFLVGLIRWRLYVGRVLGGVAAAVRGEPEPVEAGALGAALGDASLEILPA
jgi:hypothetical protein